MSFGVDMSHWEYRILHEQKPDPYNEDEPFVLIEYYHLDDGAWCGISKPRSDSPEGIRRILERMLLACDKPLIEATEAEDNVD